MRASFPAHRTVLCAVLALGLVAAACAGDDGESGDTTTSVAAGSTTTLAATTTVAPTTTVAAPVRGGTLKVGVEAEAGNPWVPQEVNCDASCFVRLRSVLEPMFAVDVDGTVQPYLAESISHNADATVWTTKIRSGIKFHDGTPLDAEALKENFVRYIKSALVGAALVDIARNPDGSPQVVVKDSLTLETTLKRPWYDYPFYTIGLIASPKWLKEADADTSVKTHPVGTGPFKFVSWKASDTMVVERNPDYWQKGADGLPLPYLDRIEFKVITDREQRANALKTGAVDLIHTDYGEVIKDFRTDNGIQLYEQESNGETFYTLLHVGQPGSPLQDQRVRCGLGAAIDSQALIDTSGGGILPVANGPFSPGQQGHLKDNGNKGYDLELAKKLIAEYTAEKGQPKIILSTVTDIAAQQSSELIQSMWTKAGASVEVKIMEQAKLITNALLGDKEFMAFGWRNHGGYVVDSQYVWWHKSTALPQGLPALNFGRLNDPVINDLLDKNRSEPDPAKREQYAEEINRRFAEQCWILPTSWAIWAIATSQSVGGVGTSTLPGGQTLRDSNGAMWLAGVWKK
ncbi:MAG TPA: ABC transporter substrate-binding protein [Acidimicrobiales bacterium]